MPSRDFLKVIALTVALGFLLFMPWFLTFCSVPSFGMVSVNDPSTETTTPLLYDNFTEDSSLNASLWQVNGPVGSVFGPDEVGISLVALEPAFSSAGMEIAQVNASQEVGTIQSIESFTPPFTATAVVEGTVSNGHTFGFAISTANASSGVVVYGNLNTTNCSHLTDCGDPTVCGTPANSSIAPNQCFYGIDAKIGQGGAHWARATKLYLTPSVNVIYSIQISVGASGNAQYSVSQGGQVLGQSTSEIGTGPFYVILEQGEGSPVLSPGPNQAYWMLVSLTAAAPVITTSTLPSSSPSLSTFDWLIIIVVIIVLIIPLWYTRRRALTVEVEDSQTFLPVFGAAVSANGPEKLSGSTGKDGKLTFSSPKSGDYSIQATAGGYIPSASATVHVARKAAYTVRLDRLSPPGVQAVVGSNIPLAGPSRESTGTGVAAQNPSLRTPQPQVGATGPSLQGTIPAGSQQQQSATPRSSQQEPTELEGFAGERIREIIKTFQAKGAISPETALTAQELGLSRLFVRIMKRRKGKTRIFMEINGRYYLNQDALQETK